MRRFITTLLISIFIISCNADEPAIESIHTDFLIPKGAIQINKDLYYLTIGTDSDDCTMYQAYARNAATAQAIIYQNAKGNFSLSKNENTCL